MVTAAPPRTGQSPPVNTGAARRMQRRVVEVRFPILYLLYGILWVGLVFGLGALAAAPSVKYAALAITAVPVVAIVVRKPIVIPLVLLFILYTRLSDQAVLHGLPSIAQPFVLLMVLVTFVRRTIGGGPVGFGGLRGTWAALGLYLGVVMASALWAGNPSASWAWSTDLVKELLILYVIIETFDTPRSLRLGVWAFLVAGSFLAFLSVYQAFTHDYTNDFWGLAQAPIREITTGSNSQRAAGPIGDPNFYALILVALVPLALGRLRNECAWLLRGAGLLSVGLLLAATVLTYSRGALLTLVVMAVLYVPITRVRMKHVGIALLCLLPLAAVVPSSYWDRFGSAFGGQQSTGAQQDTAVASRLGSTEVAVAMFDDHPIFGVGADNYQYDYFPYALRLNVPQSNGVPHDLYLQVLSETGVLGFGTFAATILLALLAAWRARRSAWALGDHSLDGLVSSCFLALVTFVAGASFLPYRYPRYLWMLVGLAMAAAVVVQRRVREREGGRPERDALLPAHESTFLETRPVIAPRGAPVAASVRRRDTLGRQIFRGSLLSYGSFIISKAFVYLSTLILARLLVPHDFGLVGFALLVISYLDVVRDLGIPEALVFRQDIADDDAGEAFILTIVAGLVFFAVAWLLAPLAAGFFHDGRVTALTRVLALSFLIMAFGSVHGTLLQKKMRFGRRFIPDLVMAVVKGGVSIVLALHGFGYWALAWGQLAGVTADTLANWVLMPWRPRFVLRWETSRALLLYGFHICLVSLLGVAIYNGDYTVVGRVLGSTALGLYTLAYNIPQMASISLVVALSNVVFPAYARIQGDRGALQRGYLAVLRYSALLLIPIGCGLFAASPAFIHTLYRHAWWPAIPAMQALSLYGVLYAVGWHAGDVFKATGRPDVLWKTAIVHACVLIPALVVGALAGGITGVAVAQLSVAVPYSLFRFWVTRRMIGVSFGAMFGAMRTALTGGVGLLAACLLTGIALNGRAPAVAILLAQIVAGAVVYGAIVLGTDQEIRGRLAGLRRPRVAVPSVGGEPVLAK